MGTSRVASARDLRTSSAESARTRAEASSARRDRNRATPRAPRTSEPQAEQINGRKPMWVALAFVNTIGPLAYFVFGRKR